MEGHETTSTLCVWAIYCLLKHPEKQKLVLDDIMKHSPIDGRVTLESTEKMEYLDAFLKEVLRLFPP
jgi:cytochrome P450